MDTVELFDSGFGPRLVSVTPPWGAISSHAKLKPEVMGKAPGRVTMSGWVEASVHDQRQRCHDYETAKLWRDVWGANAGFVTGDGYVIIDNDQGEEFSRALRQAFPGVPRRYVLHPKHKRDAFLFQVRNFLGDPVEPAGKSLSFRKGTMLARVQLLTHGLQAVIYGTHRDTKSPYVWDRRFSFDDIPVLSDSAYDQGIKKFMELLAADGWTVPQAPPPAATNGRMATATGHAPIASQQLPEAALVVKALDAAGDLLKSFPNREVPPGETPNKIDLFLDQYENWIVVAYCLAAELGRPIASTPMAEQLWCDWSDGRTQLRQSSRDVWRSVLNALDWRKGAVGLTQLVRSFVPAPKDFPDLDPVATAAVVSAGQTPVWTKLKAEWGYLTQKHGAFVNLRDGRVLMKDGFSGLFADRAAALLAELGYDKKKSGRLSVGEIYTKQPDKLVLSNLTYAPGAPRLIPNIASDPPSYVFNSWEAPSVPALGPVHLWLDHVSFIMEGEADRFLRWCACVVQLPAEKPNWHFLVMGPPGLGKDTMVAPMRVAVGPRNYVEAQVYRLESDFTEIYEKKLLILSETSQSRHDARKLWTRLKQVLARPPHEISINRKNIEPYSIPNLAAMVMFSNEANPVYLERGDRRLHVVNRRHLKPKPSTYYRDLYAWLNHGGMEAVASYLHSFPLSDADKQEFVGGTAPSTPDKIALENQNLDPAEGVFEDLVHDAQQGLHPFDVGLATNEQIAEQIDARLKRRPSPQQVSAWLLDMERRGQGVGRLYVDPKQPNKCGPISDGKQTSKKLWHLSPKGPGGKDWTDFSNTELLALWSGKPLPPRASVSMFPAQAPDKI
jgi:hypothetical protein